MRNRNMRSSNAIISHNKMVHDKVASYYDSKHIEIYNPTEQKRIATSIGNALSLIQSTSVTPKVFDFGSGTGNLTEHILKKKAYVVAGDVSPGALMQLQKKIGNSNRLETILLNGNDLASVNDNFFDMVTTYSVLHHIPDYLKAVRELVRVLKPGGVLYIDHEACPSYWKKKQVYIDYLKELGKDFYKTYLAELTSSRQPQKSKGFKKLLGPFFLIRNQTFLMLNWLSGLTSTGSNSMQHNLDEGDIHITGDDHIEWDEIKVALQPCCEILLETDYLVCREKNENPAVWQKWRDKCSDMRMIVAQKKSIES